MAKDTAKKSTKPRKNAAKPTKAQTERDERGRFLNSLLKNAGNTYATKYADTIPDAMREWFKKEIGEGEYPTFEGFAGALHLTTATFRLWREEYPRFCEAYNECKEMQENFIVRNGIKGRIDTNFSKFVLNVYHNKTEKRESDVNLKGGADFSVNIEIVDKVKKD